MSEKICQECGGVLDEGCEFCRNCGAPCVTEKIKLKKICDECGAEISADAKVCSECGAPVNKTNNVCGECGMELTEGAAVCSGCGAPTKEAKHFCIECGRLIPLSASVCTECGAPQHKKDAAPAAANTTVIVNESRLSDSIAVCAMIFGFLLPPVGLIFSIIGIISYGPGMNKKMSIAALIISVIVGVAMGITIYTLYPSTRDAIQAGNDMTRLYNEFYRIFNGGAL